MRILLVTPTAVLPFVISQVLNPENNYCAIVTDDIAAAKNFAKNVGMPENIFYPFYDLKECLEDFHYDCVVSYSNDHIDGKHLAESLNYCKVPPKKYVSLSYLNSPRHFLLKAALDYYKQHAAEFEMIATGLSYISYALNFYQFKKNLFNFAMYSQDLYYDYQIAKYVFSTNKGGDGLVTR